MVWCSLLGWTWPREGPEEHQAAPRGRSTESGCGNDPTLEEYGAVTEPDAEECAGERLADALLRVGANLLLVGSRADSDFVGLGLTRNESYSRLDARIRVAIGGGLDAFLVGDNLTDEHYQEALGYAALGRAVRVGVSFRSGR